MKDKKNYEDALIESFLYIKTTLLFTNEIAKEKTSAIDKFEIQILGIRDMCEILFESAVFIQEKETIYRFIFDISDIIKNIVNLKELVASTYDRMLETEANIEAAITLGPEIKSEFTKFIITEKFQSTLSDQKEGLQTKSIDENNFFIMKALNVLRSKGDLHPKIEENFAIIEEYINNLPVFKEDLKNNINHINYSMKSLWYMLSEIKGLYDLHREDIISTNHIEVENLDHFFGEQNDMIDIIELPQLENDLSNLW